MQFIMKPSSVNGIESEVVVKSEQTELLDINTSNLITPKLEHNDTCMVVNTKLSPTIRGKDVEDVLSKDIKATSKDISVIVLSDSLSELMDIKEEAHSTQMKEDQSEFLPITFNLSYISGQL